MRSYPIWNIVTACIYNGSKSYGVKETGEVEVRVGTSASNSHTFLTHTTTHRLLDDGSRKNSVRGAKITISLDLVTTTKIKNSVRVETLEEIRGFFLSVDRDSIGLEKVGCRTKRKDATPPKRLGTL